MNKINIIRQQTFIFLFAFVGSVFALLFLYWGILNINIFINRSIYKRGLFVIEKYDCGDGDTNGLNCDGYGTINNNKTKVNLGVTPGVTTIYGDKTSYADLNKSEYEVYYKSDMKQTILDRGKETELRLKSNYYLKKGLLNLLFPFVYVLLIFYYNYLEKKIKLLENEKK